VKERRRTVQESSKRSFFRVGGGLKAKKKGVRKGQQEESKERNPAEALFCSMEE